MSATSEPRLPFDVEPIDEPVAVPRVDGADADARRHAVDPARNVVLEASAGTGKTRVLVERYVNLLRAGVDPGHILAITFTRKAAGEMRDRIIDRLREAGRQSAADLARWRDLKDRLDDIAISTIDAFCLSLLREFPLEADVDPGFDLADETEVPRLVDESLDQALRVCRAIAAEDDDVALVFAQLGERRLRAGLGALLDRRLVAPSALARYLDRGPRDLTAPVACRTAAERLGDIFRGVRDGVDRFLADGPRRHPQFAMLADDIRALSGGLPSPERGDAGAEAASGLDQPSSFRALVERLRAYFLTQDGRPREKGFAGTGFRAVDCASEDAWKRHRQSAAAIAPAVADAIEAFRRDLNVVMSRGVWRIFAITIRQYRRTLDAHALVDFSGVLERAVGLLKQMDEFAESRFRLESRYQHVLVDEFQDTSRVQWELVAQLVRTWGEGMGASAAAFPPSIFIVGDRKQSIYGFRDADVTLLDEASSFIAGLRPDGDPRRAISVSFRAKPALLAFVNDVFDAIAADAGGGRERFRWAGQDRFVEDGRADQRSEPDLGLVVGETVRASAERVADEIGRLVSGGTVRDRATGINRRAQPADVAILFRSRESHREFERALEGRGISTYVYKGLGFFEADEIQDVVALLRYLADPLSNLRAATFCRSRLVQLSDRALAKLAPGIAQALIGPEPPEAALTIDARDAVVFERLRRTLPRWQSWVDRRTPSELLGAVLEETGYLGTPEGGHDVLSRQARENLKKLRGIVGRFQNRGYATLSRVAGHLDRLAIGDESNAAIDARDAVSLMTVHAAKGLEFPIVFVVNIGRGTGGPRPPIRVGTDAAGEPAVAIADYQSEADEEALARDREETKRLLYVALTRARDRLYLSATAPDGVCRMGRGGLGEVLPQSLKSMFAAASASPESELAWPGGGGRLHRFRVPAGAIREDASGGQA